MNLQARILEYLMIVGIAYGTYAIILTPIFYFGSVGMSLEQIKEWLWQGLLVDLCIAYPVGKLTIKIRKKYKRLFDGK